jgi:uncharacterized protein
MNPNPNRLHVVDALRGFAIVSIMLLHNLEHFDLSFDIQNQPAWLASLDNIVFSTMHFIFSGKSYAIFALLFGLTFFIQFNNQEKKGYDFRGRFAWRLVLLFVFGFINTTFYEGDILILYTMLGFILIPVSKLSNKTVLWIVIILMLQPNQWYLLFKAVQNPNISAIDPMSFAYFDTMTHEHLKESSILQTWIGNITVGRFENIIWSWRVGKVFQTASLFMVGMLVGRKFLFVESDENRKFWRKMLITSLLSFIPILILMSFNNLGVKNEAFRIPLKTIFNTWYNLAFMLAMVSGFVLLFQKNFFRSKLNIFSPIGKMSMSNYIMQSMLGSFIYYGFGLGLYQYTGSSVCLLIGIVLALFQGYISTIWFKKHKQGPLETIWHKATWLGSKRNNAK